MHDGGMSKLKSLQELDAVKMVLLAIFQTIIGLSLSIYCRKALLEQKNMNM